MKGIPLPKGVTQISYQMDLSIVNLMEGAVRLNRFGGYLCVSISETLLASIGVHAPELGPAKRTGPTRVLGSRAEGIAPRRRVT
jgi:hypothetical protein